MTSPRPAPDAKDGSKDHLKALNNMSPRAFSRDKSEVDMEKAVINKAEEAAGLEKTDLKDKSKEELQEELEKLQKKLEEMQKQSQDQKEKDFIQQLIEALLILFDAKKRQEYFDARREYLSQQPEQKPKGVQASYSLEEEGPDEEEEQQAEQEKDKKNHFKVTEGFTFDDIEKEYKNFIKEKFGDLSEKELEEMGISARRVGEHTLILTFPDDATANAFNKGLMQKGMIQSMGAEAALEKSGSPTPLPTKPTPR